MRTPKPLLIFGLLAALAASATALVPIAYGQNQQQEQEEPEDADPNIASNQKVRRFHEVMDDLLSEFAYDVKNGQMGNIKNLALRRVTVSNTLPKSYRSYLDLLVSERIRENSRVRLISCLPCKAKTSRFEKGKFIITSPMANVSELDRAAQELGIDYFLDTVMIYHTTHMILAFKMFNAKSKELVWSRTYNSETVRSRYQKLAIDYSQVAKARVSDEYVPSYRYMIGVGGAAIPNVAGSVSDSSMMALHIRGTERFNNRRHEFGLMTTLYLTTSSLLSEYPAKKADNPPEQDEEVLTADQPQPFSNALVLSAIYTYNFFGRVETFDRIRYGVNASAGPILATGYLALQGRGGLDIYFGKKFNLAVGGLYIFPSTIKVGNQLISTKGGLGGELIVAYTL